MLAGPETEACNNREFLDGESSAITVKINAGRRLRRRRFGRHRLRPCGESVPTPSGVVLVVVGQENLVIMRGF